MTKIKTALISVSDKRNMRPLLSILRKYKIKIISSGGTFKEIKKLKKDEIRNRQKYFGNPRSGDDVALRRACFLPLQHSCPRCECTRGNSYYYISLST